MDYRWTCSCCGTIFDTLPMDYAKLAPDNWFALPEAERETRARLSSDLCAIDGREYYVGGCVEIPVWDSPEMFVWGAWVSVSRESFFDILDKWDDPVAGEEEPHIGWLRSRFEGYPDAAAVCCRVHRRSKNLRPRIVLESADYPMALEQRDGITLDRIKRIAAEGGHRT
jgi:hypothetical protein